MKPVRFIPHTLMMCMLQDYPQGTCGVPLQHWYSGWARARSRTAANEEIKEAARRGHTVEEAK